MRDQDSVRVERADVRDPESRALLDRLTEELARRYEDDGAGDFVVTDVDHPRSVFLIARVGTRLAGCGALRPYDEQTGEVKRMYVDPAVRGRKVGVKILEALEEYAVRLGFRRMLLETGTRQPEALGLYRRFGYREIEAYGFYRDDPRSICFEKELPSLP